MMTLIRWILVLIAAWLAGKLITKLKMPAILGWLIAGMFLGPHALGLLPQATLDAGWYKVTITWMQCAFGLMLGTELIWKSPGDRTGAGSFHRTGIPHKGTGDRHTASDGGSR